MRTILFFTVGKVPTTSENAAIVRLGTDPNNVVHVRNAVDNAEFGDHVTEPCDAVAALSYSTVPAAYQALVTATTITNLTNLASGGPSKLSLFAPGGASFAHTGTAQLCAVAEGPDGTLSDVTAAVGMAFVSSVPGVATVNSSGLVTGVTAGTTTITATYTVGGSTTTATKALTLT